MTDILTPHLDLTKVFKNTHSVEAKLEAISNQ